MSNVGLLIVDDEPFMRSALSRALKRCRCRIITAGDGAEAITIVKDHRESSLAVAIVDLRMPGIGGLELLAEIKRRSPDTQVLILTGRGTIRDAVQAMRLGASDFLEKPFDPGTLHEKVGAALRIWEAKRSAALSKQKPGQAALRPNLIGESEATRLLRDMARRLATNDALVLIQGESGTGKEQFARAIHLEGGRAPEPFLPIDTSALSPAVIESELFGHAKGGFTGAHSAREGLLRAAGRGTVFLDEIGDLPLPLQTRLLRVLQDREVRPVGSDKVQPVEARLIAATNKDLVAAISRGEFREDLYHRLNVVTVTMPPLRDRRDDIPLLTEHFMERFRPERPAVMGISEEASAALAAYDWPGNVRELENAVLRAFVMGTSDLIQATDLPLPIAEAASAAGLAPHDDCPVGQAFQPVDRLESRSHIGRIEQPDSIAPGTLAAHERQAIAAALEKSKGKRSEAAAILNIGVATLYRKIKKYRIN